MDLMASLSNAVPWGLFCAAHNSSHPSSVLTKSRRKYPGFAGLSIFNVPACRGKTYLDINNLQILRLGKWDCRNIVLNSWERWLNNAEE
jgi:hypothetical protein